MGASMYRFFISLVLWVCTVLPVYGEAEKCSSLRVRRNVKSLSESELQEYIDAVKYGYKQGIFDDMTAIHLRDFPATHHQPMFLLYHRYFAFDLEQRLRKFNPNISLPYWDESDDAEFPHKSFLFSPKFFGGNGDPAEGWCVTEGFIKDVYLMVPSCRFCDGCLRRQFNGKGNTIKPFTTTENINRLIENTPTFDEFRFSIERTLHFQVHEGIGKDYGDMGGPTSSNDPFFYLHHSNMDRLHVKWARRHPEVAKFVNGVQEFFDQDARVIDITYYNNETPISYYNMTAGSILHTDRPPLCYTYDDV